VDTTSGLLVTYLVNAVWQVPTITIAAALCSRLMRRVPSEYTHRLWVAALLLGTLLPLLSIGTTFGRSATTLTVAAQPQGDAPSLRPDASTHILSWLQGRSYRQPLFLTPFLTWLLTLLYAASFCYSLARWVGRGGERPDSAQLHVSVHCRIAWRKSWRVVLRLSVAPAFLSSAPLKLRCR